MGGDMRTWGLGGMGVIWWHGTWGVGDMGGTWVYIGIRDMESGLHARLDMGGMAHWQQPCRDMGAYSEEPHGDVEGEWRHGNIKTHGDMGFRRHGAMRLSDSDDYKNISSFFQHHITQPRSSLFINQRFHTILTIVRTNSQLGFGEWDLLHFPHLFKTTH